MCNSTPSAAITPTVERDPLLVLARADGSTPDS